MYSLGVIPVTFLNERKKDARELKPQSSANAVRVYFAYSSFKISALNSSTRYSLM